ncbi:hypothetical protein REJ26_003331 [Providencia stuartii]|uniref:hypothetical protein n=1 Tax=Providencia sp. 2023EL-00965 TaxID=3084975 RepID=UPI0027EC9053|nr:hypothetical protein [Providencia sp. 2023EL-00965]ELR5301554.1 hypothetical protein [Providencia stuartii]MDW7590022.1 hypothetical protein [Providencia sp. 2023EL-00965]
MNIIPEKIKLIYLSIISQIYFSFERRDSKTVSSSSYIISLTSYSGRFKSLHLTIESLLQQSLPPKTIFLWLSMDDINNNNGIPKKVSKLEKRGLIIKIKKGNIRSYKKLSYIKEILSPDISHVITADDDILYPRYWAESLINKSIKNNCVSCFRGHNFIVKDDIYNYKCAMKNNTSYDLPSFNLIPTGCSGIAYPKEAISDLVSDASLFNTLAPDTDDIWYKMMTLDRNFKCCRVNKHNVHFPIILSSLGDSLFSKNVHKNHNEINLEKCISYFHFKHYFK